MSVAGWIFLSAVGGIALYVVLVYNLLVRLKHNVAQAWSNIDVLLKQRHEELPKLIATCQQYMQHERAVLENVSTARASVFAARTNGDMQRLGTAESQLRTGLGQLFAVAENYPELRANETFRHLQTRISQLELQIADRREFYNDSVNANNVRIEQFPDLLVARALNFRARPLLRFPRSETADIDVKTQFTG